jgi:hypothetical protein
MAFKKVDLPTFGFPMIATYPLATNYDPVTKAIMCGIKIINPTATALNDSASVAAAEISLIF